MLVYLVHPKHGTHIAYDSSEVELCQKNGWVVREDKAVAEEAIVEAPKRGRPRKVA